MTRDDIDDQCACLAEKRDRREIERALGAACDRRGARWARGVAAAQRIVIAGGLACGSWLPSAHAQSPAPACGAATISGRVRARGGDHPVVGAVIAFGCAARGTVTDSAGGYVLAGVAPGRVDVTVHADGYQPLVVTVLVTDTETAYVDIELTPIVWPAQVIVLDSVHVRGQTVGDRMGSGFDLTSETEGRKVDADVIGATALTGDVDVLRALTTDPHMRVVGGPQSPAALADRGGPPDALGVTVDGLPMWNPLHASGGTAAINPDVVSAVTIHDGVPAARYGGRLSGVVDLTTGEPDTLRALAGIGTAAARATAAVPFAAGAGGVILSARRSYDGLLPGRGDGAADAMGWTDLFSDVHIGTAAGDFRAVLVASGDRVAADALNGSPVDAKSGMGWRSQTFGLIWSRKLGAIGVTARAWDAEFAAAIDVTAGMVNRNLASHAGSTGAAAEMSDAGTDIGASVEQLRTRYDITGLSPAGLLAAAAATTVLSAFAAHRWDLATGRLAMEAGVRVAETERTGPRLEPRLSIVAIPLGGVSIEAGYARMHQFDQSLRNDESPLTTVFGVDLPVAVGTPRVPLAQSDELSVAIGGSVGHVAHLTVDGYDRWLAGLVLVAPVTSGPAAMSGFLTGTGRAWGASATLSGGDDPAARALWRATYGVGRTTLETTTGMTYHPSYALGQSGSLLLGLRLGRANTVRVAGVLATDWRTSVASAAVGWEHDPLVGAPAEVVGWSATTVGPLDATHVPMYSRVDAGIERDWHLGRSRNALSLFGGLSNVLDQRNVMGYVAVSGRDGEPILRAVDAPPISVTAGLAWRY